MSSFIGHSLFGASLFAKDSKVNTKQLVSLMAFTMLLACLPDFDYVLLWTMGWRFDPRITHSLGFCLAVGFTAWGLKSFIFQNWLAPLRTTTLFLAPLSHVVLDVFVGVHPMPLFWPISDQAFVFPFGFLPSAGRISPRNYYFWRNLLLEIGILLPLLIYMVPAVRDKVYKNHPIRLMFGLAICLTCCWIGFGLER